MAGEDPNIKFEGDPPSPQVIEQANIVAVGLLESEEPRVEVEIILQHRTLTGWAFFPSEGEGLVIVTDDFLGLSNPERTRVVQLIPRRLFPRN